MMHCSLMLQLFDILEGQITMINLFCSLMTRGFLCGYVSYCISILDHVQQQLPSTTTHDSSLILLHQSVLRYVFLMLSLVESYNSVSLSNQLQHSSLEKCHRIQCDRLAALTNYPQHCTFANGQLSDQCSFNKRVNCQGSWKKGYESQIKCHITVKECCNKMALSDKRKDIQSLAVSLSIT